jgi:DNA-binding MarR family transcriptional regulator
MSVGHEIAMALRAAYWAMHRQADACLQPGGVTANQFVLLALLAEEDGVTQRELVDRASSDANTVRAMLVALEAKGLLTRARSDADARARCIRLTAAGRRTYRTLWAESEGFRLRLAAVLTDAEQVRFLDMLDRVARVNTSPARPVSTAQGG